VPAGYLVQYGHLCQDSVNRGSNYCVSPSCGVVGGVHHGQDVVVSKLGV
jgi:hypothetical protein